MITKWSLAFSSSPVKVWSDLNVVWDMMSLLFNNADMQQIRTKDSMLAEAIKERKWDDTYGGTQRILKLRARVVEMMKRQFEIFSYTTYSFHVCCHFKYAFLFHCLVRRVKLIDLSWLSQIQKAGCCTYFRSEWHEKICWNRRLVEMCGRIGTENVGICMVAVLFVEHILCLCFPEYHITQQTILRRSGS